MTPVRLYSQARTRTWLSRTWTPQSHPIISKELNSRGSSRKSSVRLDYRPESSRGRSKRSLGSIRRPWADTTRARYRDGIARASTSGISRIPGRVNKVRASLARFRHATLIAGRGAFSSSSLYMFDDRATFSGCFALEVNHNNCLEIRMATHASPPRQIEDVSRSRSSARILGTWNIKKNGMQTWNLMYKF